MAPAPAWVVKDLVSVTGFDNETISQQILPYLESFSSSVKLKRHLEEFIGSSGPAITFTDKYINYRFPSLPVPTPVVPPRQPDKPSFASSSKPASRAPSASTSRVPSRAPSPDKLSAQFGTNGKVYIKNQDSSEWGGFSKKHSASGAASPNLAVPGSGSSTPAHRGPSPSAGVPVRSRGLEIKEAKPKKAKASSSTGPVMEDGQSDKAFPKSKETKVLEARIRALTGETTSDTDVETLPSFLECFCQARNHPLSTYTPSCISCGLILCNLQQPHQPCPSCATTLLSASQRDRLVAKLYTEIEEQLSKEQAVRDQREQVRRERILAESGGGHFPTLNGKPIISTAANKPEARKVLTLGGAGGKGKGRARATLTTYSTPASSAVSPFPSNAPSPSLASGASPRPTDSTVGRPREGPFDATRIEKEWAKTVAWRKESARPWGDLQATKTDEAWVYTPKPELDLMLDDEEIRRESRRKKMSLASQGIGLDGRLVPGAA